jgi:hypothetical protein
MFRDQVSINEARKPNPWKKKKNLHKTYIGSIHRVYVKNVADTSGVRAASVFRVHPKNAGSMYLRNIGNTTHIQAA